MSNSGLNNTEKIRSDVDTHINHFKELYDYSAQLYCAFLKTNDVSLQNRASAFLSSAAVSVRSIVEIPFRHFEFQKHQEVTGKPFDKDNDRFEFYSVKNKFENDLAFNKKFNNWISFYGDVLEAFRLCTRLDDDMRYVIFTSNYAKHVSLDVIESIHCNYISGMSKLTTVADGNLVLEKVGTPTASEDDDGNLSFNSSTLRFHSPSNATMLHKTLRLSHNVCYYLWKFPNGESEDVYYGVFFGSEMDDDLSFDKIQPFEIVNGEKVLVNVNYPKQPFYDLDFGAFFYHNELIRPKVEIESRPFNSYKSVWNAFGKAQAFSEKVFEALK